MKKTLEDLNSNKDKNCHVAWVPRGDHYTLKGIESVGGHLTHNGDLYDRSTAESMAFQLSNETESVSGHYVVVYIGD